MHFRSVLCLTAILALAVPAQAAIMIDVSAPVDLGAGGLQQFTISAVGDAGEVINTFTGISVTGNVHQVGVVDPFGGPPGQTTRIDQTNVSAFNAAWRPWDSHVLITDADRVGNVGAPLMESNDQSTTSTLGLPMLGTFDAPSGFGNIGSVDGTDSFALIPAAAGSNIPFLQVVTTQGTAFLNVLVNAVGGIEARFQEVEIGGGGPSDTTPPQINLVDYGTYHIDDDPDPIWVDLDAFEEESLPVVWSGLTYDGGPGKNTDFSGQDDGLLTDDGVFHWDPRGWRQGEHFFSAVATDQAGNASQLTTAVRVDLWVPEPATASLLGLALLGLVGFTRRRG